MRILLTTDTIGGVWTFTRELTQQLLAEGHAVCLVSFGRAPTAGQLAWSKRMGAEHGSSFAFRASDAPLEWMQDNANALDGTECLRAAIDEFGPDVLHANQFCWGAVGTGLPTVITAHSDVMSWAAACKPDILQGSAWLARYCALVQRGLDGADCVAAPTQWMQRALDARFHVPCEFTVIRNCRTVPAAPAPRERKLQAVTVGRLWDEAKGLRSLAGLDAAMPILVAGEDAFDSASAPASRLQALGFLDEPELFQLFRESSIYIAASIYEPFGLAPLEAALCGCAILARDLPSLREVWADTALFYDTPEELAAFLRQLAADPEMLRVAQANARARAGKFTPERTASEYLALYKSLALPGDAGTCHPQEFATHAA